MDMVKSMDFGKVVVVINSSNAIELGLLEEDGIDAALWIGGPGSTGNNSVGKVLAGTVNPSGRLVDTYAYDLPTAPAYYNAGDFKYSNTGVMTEEEEYYHTILNYNE
ncbi:glycoside hydrolase family 3 C-terminal domain-containing protein, partial [Clostridium perfringens]|uniref:glycoside hydrolase family 3 C-terminal domain-containing protein n=1 Tax=Clostridium perfringens TaxID=1502 RepID=UPI0038FCE6F0